MKRLAILLAVLATLVAAAPAQAQEGPYSKYCGVTEYGWHVDANVNTSCAYARRIVRAVDRYERRHGLYDGESFIVRVKDNDQGFTEWKRRKVRCRVDATGTVDLLPVIRCHEVKHRQFGRVDIYQLPE